tara:strand:+ start:4078 stop:4719 length:642 start_codon:yes stop_codon:yes gene_type:complete
MLLLGNAFATQPVSEENPRAHEVHAGPERNFSTVSEAVVEVRTILGYGTGTVFQKNSRIFVLTAAHVVDDYERDGFQVFAVRNGESVEAEVVYFNQHTDIAILEIDEMTTVSPIRLKKRRASLSIGDRVAYCGFPNRADLACFAGLVSSMSPGVINVHSYAWMGASGSFVFDERGRAVGVLSAIEVGRFIGMPILIEDVVWVMSLDLSILEGL